MANQDGECLWCDRAIALIGLVIGIGVTFIAADVLTGGLLTRSLTGRKLATVIDFPGKAADEPA